MKRLFSVSINRLNREIFFVNNVRFLTDKITTNISMSDDKSALLSKIGLENKKIKSIIKDDNVYKKILSCINEANITGNMDKDTGNLIYKVAISNKINNDCGINNRKYLLNNIINGNIKSNTQLSAGIEYITTNPTFDINTFKKHCGVGITISESFIKDEISKIINKHSKDITLKGKKMYPVLFKEVTNLESLKWGDNGLKAKIFKEMFNKANVSNNGNNIKSPKKKDKIEAKVDDDEEVVTLDKYIQGRDIGKDMKNTDKQLQDRKAAVGNVFLSRFPPEPNGFLHIGHAKAMNFNFGLASKKQGNCYLRFDDTNPTTEKQLFIDSIIENVKWMGFNPWKITYSSDYFTELYELAIKMIKDGNAYVCHMTGDEVKLSRETYKGSDKSNIKASPWRSRSVDENLKEFHKMKIGYYAEGEACLRMKGDLQSSNPNMWDHVCYRIMYHKHPMTNDKWCIYPTYDYTHCIIDSLEWITASCCTLEFENRRESYFWLLDILELYKPYVWEYSRLNITHNVLSKRKLLKLVNNGYVRGWDDCRLLTIEGLRRRGYTAEVIRNFVDKTGVTRKDNFISPKLLEAVARDIYNVKCKRGFAVIDPIKIVITNYDDRKQEMIKCMNYPNDKSKVNDTHEVKFGKIVYISGKDFKENADKNYFGLSVGKTCRLRYAYNITCNSVTKDNNGNIVSINCTYDETTKHDIKGVKHGHLPWVYDNAKYKCEFRLYDNLFTVERPGGDNWLDYLNENSEIIVNGYIDEFIAKCGDNLFQFEREGYFVRDKDTTNELNVFNRTVTLRESTTKKNMKKQNKKRKK